MRIRFNPFPARPERQRNFRRASVPASLFRTITGALFLFSAVPASADETVTISKEGCRQLVRHRPDADVAYQPGVDVNGNPVVPADLGGGSPIQMPEVISIDIGFELDEKYGFGSGGRYSGSSKIGTVTVRDGEVFYNGHRLDDAGQTAIAAACRDAYDKP